MEEIWKDIKEYEGLYQVSNLGRIKSLDRIIKSGISNSGYIKINGKILKKKLGKNGYLSIQLWKEGKGKWFMVHRLIAIAFIPNPQNKPYIDHINTIRNDNRIENLRWATREENDHNPITLKNRIGKCGIKIKCLNTGEVFVSSGEARRKLGISAGNIIGCCKGKRKSAKGYKFEYYKD